MNNIKVIFPITILLFLLVGCSQPKAEALPTYTPYPTYTPAPTYTAAPTQTAVVIVITATPLPAQTSTTAPTATPLPNLDQTTKDKTEGAYLVGSEVAPGQWRGSGDCGIQIYDKSGMLLDAVTQKRSMINVPATAYRVEFWAYEAGCTWSYLGP
jgi:hypothetical protein